MSKKSKKVKIQISKEDWKAIKGITKAHNHSIFDFLDWINPREVTAIILHLSLSKLTVSDIREEINSKIKVGVL
jgi:hypothetical protein